MSPDEITLCCPVARSPRVLQVAGMFDLPLEDKASLTLRASLPLGERPWSIGLVTGPSGAGKSTLARHLWPGAMAGRHDWPADAALVDGFPASMGIREVTGLLSAVGLSSPPAWVRPYRTLSNGEAFRADVARALAGRDGLVVIDEFTSVVDRQVAKVASHAVQKAVRRSGRQLVAVTCHYDVEDWLQPDWAYDVAAAELSWRQVQPHPPVRLGVHAADRSLWPLFARHHYLSAGIHQSARCFAAFHQGRPVAFAAYLHFPHPRAKNIKVSHRVVVLPDWQGLGIGGRLSEWLGQHLHEQGLRFRATTAHPARIAYYARSPRWRLQPSAAPPGVHGPRSAGRFRASQGALRRLSTRTFEYAPA
jgi:GNAT superfamily N-acetyltransferase